MTIHVVCYHIGADNNCCPETYINQITSITLNGTSSLNQNMIHVQHPKESKPKTHNEIHTTRSINKTCIKIKKT